MHPNAAFYCHYRVNNNIVTITAAFIFSNTDKSVSNISNIIYHESCSITNYNFRENVLKTFVYTFEKSPAPKLSRSDLNRARSAPPPNPTNPDLIVWGNEKRNRFEISAKLIRILKHYASSSRRSRLLRRRYVRVRNGCTQWSVSGSGKLMIYQIIKIPSISNSGRTKGPRKKRLNSTLTVTSRTCARAIRSERI